MQFVWQVLCSTSWLPGGAGVGVGLARGLWGFLICTAVLGAFGTSPAASMQASRLSLCGTVRQLLGSLTLEAQQNGCDVSCSRPGRLGSATLQNFACGGLVSAWGLLGGIP